MREFRKLEVNGGQVQSGASWSLRLPPVPAGYADAQFDDRFARRRRDLPWRPGTTMHCRARFSAPVGELVGTAGFGFWNAPFAEPTLRWLALPQATWFFYASEASNLPLATHDQPGRGWFASTVDATTWAARSLIPLAPAVLLLNQLPALRHRLWPLLRRRLGIAYAQLDVAITDWHHYALEWRADGCTFLVDNRPVLVTPASPQGPLAFVCWIDNQFLSLTLTGRFRWGTQPVARAQWLEVADLTFS